MSKVIGVVTGVEQLEKFTLFLGKAKAYVAGKLSETSGIIKAETIRNIASPNPASGRVIANEGTLSSRVLLYPDDSMRGEYGVVVNTNYAQAIEKGTKPHKVSLRAIMDGSNEGSLTRWARLKLLANAKSANGKRMGKSAKQANAFLIARAVARKIARVGTKAQPFFMPAVDKGVKYFIEMARLDKVVK